MVYTIDLTKEGYGNNGKGWQTGLIIFAGVLLSVIIVAGLIYILHRACRDPAVEQTFQSR